MHTCRAEWRMGKAPCLLLNLLPHRFGVWISRLAVRHAPSAFKVFAKALAPFPPSCQRTPSPLSDCPLEMLQQEEFSCRLCCRGLQFQDPTSAFSKCFCIPFLCFSACVLFPEALHVVVPCPSAHLLGFPWGSTAVPGLTTCREQFDAQVCAEKNPFQVDSGAFTNSHICTHLCLFYSAL